MSRVPSVSVSILSLLASSTCLATTLQVCPSGCDFRKIQAAVNAASSGDTIQVARGRYVENVTIIGKNLTIVGSGNGRTIVQGADIGSVFQLGSGVDSPNAEISISNLTVTQGLAFDGGGIAVLRGAFAHLEGIIAVSNIANSDGAGFYINTPGAPTTTIKGCSVHNNKVDQPRNPGFGGGIAIISSDVTIESSTITRNHIALWGGGVGISSGLAGSGGPAAHVTITSSTIVDNSADLGAGVGFDGGNAGNGSLTISKSDISRNNSAFEGGGLTTSGRTTVSDTIIGRNVSRDGGGIFNSSGGILTLTNDYIVQNNGTPGTGGVTNYGTMTLSHTLIKDNAPNDCSGASCPP